MPCKQIQGAEVELYSLLTSALDRGVYLFLKSTCFTLGKEAWELCASHSRSAAQKAF